MSLNPKSYKLSPALLDEMIAHDYKKATRKFANYYDDAEKLTSPNDKVHFEI